jgi:hypothetical protein
MTSPITEQARQIASTAIQEKPASLDSPRASSVLGPDKPARQLICKCGDPFHADSIVCHRCGRIRP